MHKLILGVAAVISTVAGAAEDLPVTDGLKHHYDASAEGTILCNDAGAVTNWAPVTGTLPMLDAGTAYPDATYPKAPVTTVTEGGRIGLRLSHTEGSDGVYTFLCLPAGASVPTTRTLFIVSRQIDEKYYGSIVGRNSNYDYRLNRDSDNSMAWKPMTWTDGKFWINGQEKESSAIGFAEYGGTAMPHVLAVTSADGKWPSSIGAAGVDAANGSTLVYDKCVVHEAIYYSRQLSDDEVVRVSRYLIAKWGLFNPFPVVWTGEGASSNWSDADNWDGGAVPGVEATVQVADGATITLDSAEIEVKRIEPVGEGAVTLTLGASAGIRADLKAEIDSNVSLAFAGPGTLVCNDSISARSPIVLKGGTLAPVSFSAAKYGTVSAHLDASVEGSVVANGSGEVQSWNSLDGGANFKSPLDGAVLDTASYTYQGPKNRPIVATSANGKPCVRFGSNANGEFMPSFLKGDVDFKTRTVIFVSTVKSESGPDGLYGNVFDANYRVLRPTGTKNQVKDTVATSSVWCNGKAGVEGVSDSTASGATKPSVFVSRRTDNYSWITAQVIGGAWLQDGNTKRSEDSQNVVFGEFDLHEFISYSTALTDDQIREVAVYLMNKWGAPRQAADYTYVALPEISPVLTSDATIDSGFFDFSLSSLAIDAGGLLTAPCLSVIGAIDLGDVDLALTGIGKLENDPKILTATSLGGDSPKSVSGLLDGFKLKKSGNDLFLKCPRGLMLLFR